MDCSTGLNDAQKKAVSHRDGPLLVLAGAGAGKTRVITCRIHSLIRSGIDPAKILAITFTNKAAGEMKERVRVLLEGDPSLRLPVDEGVRPFIGTFHALGVFLLKRYARFARASSRFTIYDRDDSLRAIKSAMIRAGIDPKQFEPRKLLSAISRQKGNALSCAQYLDAAENDYFPRLVGDVWQEYERILAKEKAYDFDDLLLEAVRLLKEQPAILTQCQDRWHYLLIDEYQDTNKVQYEIARLIAGERRNICVVGDVDQNIYSWRGADIGHLMSFERTFPGAQIVLLEENYRSTKTILAASNDVIRKNKRRPEKTLFTGNPEGEPISLLCAYDEAGEAGQIAARAAALIADGASARSMAVLYRANFQSRALEEAFLDCGIPYQVLGTRFFDRKEVRDVLSFLRLAQNPQSTSDLSRVINVPPRGIGKTTLMRIVEGKDAELSGAMRARVGDFMAMVKRIGERMQTAVPSALIKYTLHETGIEESLAHGSDEDRERLENLRELVSLATRYDALPKPTGIEQLIEDAVLAAEQDELKEERDAVRLMTVHASKGLEFDRVFITGLEEGLFPHHGLSDEKRDDEEERRLFYVALTRARKKVFLSYASVRTLFGSREVTIPSSFIGDIDQALIEVEDPDVPAMTMYLD
jgi:DNA helicase-2/ATP-dependent DNA helicase PcrA